MQFVILPPLTLRQAQRYLRIMQNRTTRTRARFDRQYRKIAPHIPGMARLRNPGWMPFRVIAGVLLLLGGMLAVLPVFGLWMIPVGLSLLAIDVPMLQGPVTRLLIRGRRRLNLLRRRF